MSAAKWFRITCSSLACKFTSTRRAETPEEATDRTCPKCGCAVLAAPAGGSVGLGTVMFRQDGGGGITK